MSLNYSTPFYYFVILPIEEGKRKISVQRFERKYVLEIHPTYLA